MTKTIDREGNVMIYTVTVTYEDDYTHVEDFYDYAEACDYKRRVEGEAREADWDVKVDIDWAWYPEETEADDETE